MYNVLALYSQNCSLDKNCRGAAIAYILYTMTGIYKLCPKLPSFKELKYHSDFPFYFI